jgi:phospholipid/cholesterol/gamma-HCH transport system ATP-binding protein
MRAAIELRNITVDFDGLKALDDVSLALQPGRMIVITGAAGSGKSVLLRVANGLQRVDSGQVLIDGREIEQLEEHELLKLRSQSIGMVFQERSLFTGISVYENAAYRLEELGWPEDKIEKAVLEVLEFVGLSEDVDKFPEELSIGMGQRLEFARALIGWPSLMLLDEPTAGLDPINERVILDLVIRARDLHGVSSLYVTKELHELSYLSRHRAEKNEGGGEIVKGDVPISVIVLDRGRIVFEGDPVEFFNSGIDAVVRLTRPTFSVPFSESRLRDPWRRSRRPA